MNKKAIIIYGPPGAGKGTQANFLSWITGFVHFDTGKFIEQTVHDPSKDSNEIIQKEKKLFDCGLLSTPSWVLEIVKEKTAELAKAGLGIIFSGSPRTIFEAFGSKKQKGLMNVLEEYYGKKKIFILILKIPAKESIWRNSHRLICSVCGMPVLAQTKSVVNSCPICLGPLRARTLDKPEIIKIRLKEYRKRTEPIFKELEKKGYKILEINGMAAPYLVLKNILPKINT